MKEFFKVTKFHYWIWAAYLGLSAVLEVLNKAGYRGSSLPNWLFMTLYWPVWAVASSVWSYVFFPLLHHEVYALLHSPACTGSNGAIAALQCVGFGIQADIPPDWFWWICLVVVGGVYIYLVIAVIRWLYEKFKTKMFFK